MTAKQNILAFLQNHPEGIDDDALKRIFEYTRGIPCQINRLCATALIAGRIDQKQILDESTIRKAIAEMEQA